MEHKESKNSLDFELQIIYISSIRTRSRNEDIVKNLVLLRFLKKSPFIEKILMEHKEPKTA